MCFVRFVNFWYVLKNVNYFYNFEFFGIYDIFINVFVLQNLNYCWVEIFCYFKIKYCLEGYQIKQFFIVIIFIVLFFLMLYKLCFVIKGLNKNFNF